MTTFKPETVPPGAAGNSGAVPRLEMGDHLTREEFERRWEAMPQLKKAELIEGVVYMAAAVRAREHGSPHALVMTWLGYYRASTPGVGLEDNTSVRLDADNEPQPDALLRLPQELGGTARVSADGYLEGPPELVAEVAASSTSYDLHAKLDVYRRVGVREYVVWRVLDGELDWFVLRQGRYKRQTPSEGLFKSEVFPGLWLDAPALLRDDLARVLEVVRQGTSTPEHAAFLEQLAGA